MGVLHFETVIFEGAKNPKVLFKKTVGKQRVTVWCGMTADRLISPFLLNETMNADRYLTMLSDDVWPLVHNEPGLRFMQDGAPPHWAKRVRQWLDVHFQNRWIGRGGPIAWPARSPDLTPCDFFLWGWVKNKVYKTMPANIDELRDSIRVVMANVPQTFLANAVAAVPRRLQKLVNNAGGYVEF